jgi:hypothetical protein
LRNPLAWGITYVDLLENKQWEVETRRWIVEPYLVLNPWALEKYPVGQPRRMSIEKSTQAGISTMALVKVLHFATNWSVRIGYTLPRDQDALDFTSTRFDPVIKASTYLRSKLGQPDSAHAKQIGKSYIFFLGMNTEPRMMPLDAVYVDEVDLSDPDNLSTVLNRLDASRWALNFFLSTPTVAGYGIDGLISTSDMREWMVQCPQCNTWQSLDWEQNLRIVGPQNKPERVYYGCASCNTELTPEHIQTGQWVPQQPDLTNEHTGYHITQMMTKSAPELYKHYRDPQTKLAEFYRKRLGKPYEIGGGSISRDDFLVTCFDEPYAEELSWMPDATYYMGIDQGNELQVIIGKIENGSKRKKIVHVEIISIEKGFRRAKQLMELFKVRYCVIDGNPNRHDALDLQKAFPGRVLVADYNEQKQTWRATKASGKTFLTNVAIDRTAAFDDLIESIKKGEWQLPGEPPSLPNDVELVIDHLTALKRDVQERKTKSGSAEQVAVWVKLRADHLAHSWSYLKTAIGIDRGRGLKVAILGKKKTEEGEIEEDENTPATDIMVGIVALLAEVPKRQLAEYLGHWENEKYVMPFPLSFKIGKVVEKYQNHDDVIWTILNVLLKDYDYSS